MLNKHREGKLVKMGFEKFFSKHFTDSDLTEWRRLYQRDGALTAKVQSPLDLRRVRGINNRPWLYDIQGWS